MITSFKLGNFKAFGETQDMPLRPITLVFGPNSGGKSSIIHGLLLGRRILETGEVDLHQATFQDQVLDLGGFRQYVHGHDLNQRVRWGIEIRPNAVASHEEAIAIDIEVADRRERSAVDGLPDVTISSLEISVGHQCLMRLGYRSNGGLGPDYVNLQHPMLNTPTLTESYGGEGLSSVVSRMYGSDEAFIEALSDMWETTSLHAQTKHAAIGKSFASMGLGSLLGGLLFGAAGLVLAPVVAAAMSKKEKTADPDTSKAEHQPLADVLELLPVALESTLRLARADIIKVQYLGPLRSYPSRVGATRAEQNPSWLSDGQHAWDILRNNPSVRVAVNEWLGNGNRLDTPYRLERRELIDLRAVMSAIASHEHDMDYDAMLSDVATAGASAQSQLVLVDCRTNIELILRDVGIGVSQVIPVLVNAMGLEEHMITIEQPEIHLHPALQAELADVFIESALGERRNTFLLETHSEHLILRIMRRIRECRQGRLPQGMPSIGPDDVAILYVEPVGESSFISLLELDEYGQLIDPWPGGFFEEGFRERFS